MRRMLPALGLVGAILLGCVAAQSAERPLEFLEALRRRDYFDYAILYLEELEGRSDLSADVREVLAYERGMTLLENARSSRDPETQARLYDEARVQFEKFLKDHPEHPLAGPANTEVAQVFTGKAQALVLQANSPNNSGRRAELQQQARGYLGEARKVFQAAHDRYKAEYDKFDKFIPESDKVRYSAREKAFVNYAQAQFHLARMLHEEAQTHERGSSENRKLLTDAANAFEAIHARYRSLVVGLFARMWQGKCFEEMDELTKALGIYNELLNHRGKDNSPLEDLQARVLQFRLVCLNHEKRKDSQVVIQEAQAWLKANRNPPNQRVALGIQWEMVRAQEALSRAESTSEADRRRLQQQALDTARKINRYPGEYKDASTAMIRRLLAELDRGSGDPKDFATAFSLARTQVDEIRAKNAQIQQAQGAERQKLVDEMLPVAREAARTLSLALSLANRKDDTTEINRARYYLAYVYYLLRDRSYDAAVLCEFVARKFQKDQPDLALDAAYLAQAAYIQAYHREAKERRGPEIGWVVEICNYITTNWPASDKAQDARMNLGGMYAELGQPAEAAKWYASVPETAPQFLDAQLKAGNAWWNVYVQEQTRPDGERKPKEQIDELLQQSRKTLEGAITRFEGQLPKEAAQVDQAKFRDLSLPKLTLATILNGAGDYKGALGLLVDSPLSVVAALPSFQPGTKHHRDVAILAYVQILRAYIGTNELAKAQAAQKELDNIVSQGGGGQALTQVYVDFGTQLKKEVQRLQAARDPRLAEVLKSFESFLDEVAKRQEGQTYYSLRWIAETYRELGEGLAAGDQAKAQGYFSKAISAYRQILDEDRRQPGFIPGEQASGVQLQIVRSQRLQQAFEEAEQGILQILKARPRALDAQEEAARLYADWAARGSKGDLAKWAIAIEGDKNLKKRKAEDKVVWGWFGISQRIENSLNQTASAAGEDLEKQYFESRYQTALCRFRWGQAEPTDAKRRERLGMAYRDILVTAATMPGLGGEESWDRFNALYRDIQQEMINAGKFDEVAGRTQPADLERREAGEGGTLARKSRRRTTSPGDAAAQEQVASSTAKKAAPAGGARTSKDADRAAPAAGGTSFGPWIAAVVLLLAAVGAVAGIVRSQGSRGRKRRREQTATEPAPAKAAPATSKSSASRSKSKPA